MSASSVYYTCDGTRHDTIGYAFSDITSTPYWAVQAISYFTAVPEYPCAPTGGTPTWGVNFDWPWINGDQIQQYNTGGGLVQIGEGYCINGGQINCSLDSMGPANTPLLVYTPNDTNEQYIEATWFNEGYGAGVLYLGHQYELSIAVSNAGAQWQFGIRDVTANTGWTYHAVTKSWITAGGNEPWWGFETNNYASAFATDINHNPYINTMEYKTNDGLWHHDPNPDSSCPGTVGTFPSYYQCYTYGTNGYNLEGWTNAH